MDGRRPVAPGIVEIHLLLCSAAAYLQGAYGLHLSAVADADHVKLRKAALGGRQRTRASLTRNGRQAFAGHVRALQALLVAAESAPARAAVAGRSN